MILGHDVEEAHMARATEYINSILVPILQRQNATYTIDSSLHIVDGSTEAIGRKVLEHATDASVIVCGSTSASHGGVPEFLFGSLSNYIDHHATVPVIVVH